MPEKRDNPWNLMGYLYKAHPWHGIPIGKGAPHVVTTFIEMVPTDTVKYEIDKKTGHLRLDRPQRYSNVCPALYGFVPRTYCAERVGDLCRRIAGRPEVVGDGDPLDICVLSEKAISHVEITLNAIPIGGLRMVDGNEADDKVIAVLEGDAAYGNLKELKDAPSSLIDRLRHYFLTYKLSPDRPEKVVEIVEIYGRDGAHEVIEASVEDYRTHFGEG